MRSLPVVLVLLLGAVVHAQDAPNPCPNGQPVPSAFHLPAKMPAGEPFQFERDLLKYVSTLDYRSLGWCRDKWVRDTGPLMAGTASIVHLPVHVYYSPEVSNWLLHGRQGDIPDGAVIIKEQYHPVPAARYRDIPNDVLGCSNDWTIMIRNTKASLDGWFWVEVWNGSKPSTSMSFTNKFQYPNGGYGLMCLRCHSSAESQLTFASLSNIEGAPGWPLQYRVDDSWRSTPSPIPAKNCGNGPGLIEDIEARSGMMSTAQALPQEEAIPPALFPQHEQNAALQEDIKALHFGVLNVVPAIQKMPPETYDNVVSAPKGTTGNGPGFVTSAQCLGCHSGLTGAGVGPTMVLSNNSKDKPKTVNVSEYGEWRWTPMGLAGRDPVFYSQLDSELAYLKSAEKRQGVVNTCEQCHGAMGKQSFAAEHPNEDFKMDFVYDTDPASEGFKYGALARDGISCEVCHRMKAPSDPSLPFFLNNQINGVFKLTVADELHGPFKDNEIATYPMVTGMNVKPTYDAYIQSPQMCGTCHTILLPVLDSPNPKEMSVEQATYPEWLNSQYRNEYGSIGETPKTCQDCHLPTGYVNPHNEINVAAIQDKIAVVQDQTYAQADHLATPDDVSVRYRLTGYKRHELLGTNGFLLQMFEQPVNDQLNNEVLGVRLSDYMSGLTTDLEAASDNVVEQAQTITATVQISKWEIDGDKLIVEATVTNLAGHRFPSGVGFRRAFLELDATMNGEPFFTSGTTNNKGQITDMNGDVLPTESFKNGQYQPHFDQEHFISKSDQVQIYEELTQDVSHEFTTEFTRRDHEIKDNRLLPIGWSEAGPPDMKIPEPYLEATLPKGDAASDPVYKAGKGQSIVRYVIKLPDGANAGNIHANVSLYSQTIPPYFLADRAETKTPATARLEYLANALGTLEKTDYVNWKLRIASASM